MFICVCTCGQGVTGGDRDEMTAKFRAHLTGRSYPAEHVGVEHAAWIGKADVKLSIDVKTEAI